MLCPKGIEKGAAGFPVIDGDGKHEYVGVVRGHGDSRIMVVVLCTGVGVGEIVD